MSAGSKDGAWRNDAKLAAGVDVLGNEHPLNCDVFGTLDVNATLTSGSIEIGKVDQGNAGTQAWPVLAINSLIPVAYDYIALSPTGTNPTTIVYKTGGSGGTTVATLTLTYDGNNNVQTVTRT